MILRLAAAAGPLKVGATSRKATSARDARLTAFGTEGVGEAVRGDYSSSDSGSNNLKDDCSEDTHGSRDAKDGGGDVHKDGCQPQEDSGSAPPHHRGSCRNPGEALAKIDFSRW